MADGAAPGHPWLWVLRPFYLWLAHRPSMLVFLAVPIAIGWGWLGAGAGIPLLLRSDAWLEQIESGVAVGLCLTHISYVGWLVLRGAQPHGRTDIPRDAHGRATLPVLAVLFGAGSIVADPHWRTVLLVATCSLTMCGGYAAWSSTTARNAERAALDRLVRTGERFGPPWRAAVRVRRRIRIVLGVEEQAPASGAVASDDDVIVLLHGIALVSIWAVLVGLYLAMQRPVVTAATSMCLLLAIVAMVWGYLRFWSRRSNLVLLVAVLGVATVQGTAFGRCHTLESLEGIPRVDLHKCNEPAVGLLDDTATLAAWRTATDEARPILVVVATSGGGVRAAGWTMVVLERLERELAGFAAHTRLVTGASGGMLGASLWVAHDDAADDRFDAVTQDALGPLFAHAALMVVGSRGLALERAWERNAPALAQRFSSLRAGEAAGLRPSLVFAPVIVEDGRRLVASHLDLAELGVAWTGTALGRASRSTCQWGALFPGIDPKISELARLSASFPYVSPAVLLPTEPWIRVVDAGYYDNYGVNLATRWIDHHADWLRANTGGVLLVQIRDRSVDWQATIDDEPSWIARVLSPWVAPLSAVLAVRTAEALFRNDEGLAALQRRFVDGFFTTATFSLAGHVSLSWRLTDAERAEVRCNLADDSTSTCAQTDASRANADALQQLAQWWHTRELAAPAGGDTH